MPTERLLSASVCFFLPVFLFSRPVHMERLLYASVCFFSPVFLFSRPVYTERLLYASVDKSRRPASASLTAHRHDEG